ncbi:MAG: hypothetical protein RML45_05140 [Acetobacteraceae bacterium]|nr:hypothetical protein [Acetobacteraceae bacterium]
MDDKSALRWYKKKWEEDNRRWEKERQALQKRLDEQAEEILELKKKLAEQGSTTSQQLREQLQACGAEPERAACGPGAL